jgi:hypothetical protein
LHFAGGLHADLLVALGFFLVDCGLLGAFCGEGGAELVEALLFFFFGEGFDFFG